MVTRHQNVKVKYFDDYDPEVKEEPAYKPEKQKRVVVKSYLMTPRQYAEQLKIEYAAKDKVFKRFRIR